MTTPRRRWFRFNGARRWKYNVRGLLLSTLLIGLLVGSVFTARRLRVAQTELSQRRNETGRLTIEDRSLVHAIAVDQRDPREWRWRLFIPKGQRYSWSLAHNSIPAAGVPNHKTSGASNEPYWGRDNEVFVTATLQPQSNGNWTLSVTSKIGDSKNQMAGSSLTIPEQDMRWMLETPSTVGRVAGSNGTQTFDPQGPIILLMRRACERMPDGTLKPTSKPMPGFMVWLEKW